MRIKTITILSIFAITLSYFNTALAVDALGKNCFHEGQVHVNDTAKLVAQLAYDKMNKNWSYKKPGSQCSTESKYWKVKEISSEAYLLGEYQQSKFNTLVLDCPPKDIVKALLDLINKRALLECKIAMQTANLLCMQYMMGDADFTAYVEAVSNHPKISQDDLFFNLSNQFLSQGEGKPIVGSMMHLTNVPSYDHFKPNGISQGINVFYMDENKYLGFGSIYLDGPQSSERIEENALASFCKLDDVQYYHMQHRILSAKYSNGINIFKYERNKAQKTKYDYYIYFDIEKLIEYEKNKIIKFQKLS